MKIRIRKSTTYISLGLSVLGLFAVALVGIFSANTPVQAQAEGGRLITVYDRGNKMTFITSEKTIGDALKSNGFIIDDHDAVEPSADEKLVADDYQVNIYRSRPVTVIDGSTRQRIMTPYQSAERIIKDAGINLYAEDITNVERSTDILGDGAGLKLTIDRATSFSFDLYGKTTEMRTQGKTIGDMLSEKKIELGEHGRVSPSFDTKLTPGLEVRVWREGKQTVTVEEEIQFEVEQIKDADRPVGYKEVKTAGQNGKKSVTYEIEIKNGEEVARNAIASVELTAPVKQVEVVGAKSASLLYTGGGTKTDWLSQSNIPEASWGYTDFMVQRESGWNPNAVNKSSGACGLAQALPCSKLGPDWSNPVVALNWMNSYVNGRYYDGSPYVGSICSGITDRWQCAHAFWQVKKWY